ncbi:3-keto-disaccharide hydrolase [Mucilaginibacter pedocola]|uniref:3-keto-alpha-glucoside-1,2-lyase/3-keto-2-hydroxy-glucal hydratase domain-containing protein n=1 Tax=Mucilaginibacter pedocola TaxID=1792845 RepID=A0A1S9PCU7_9SPHI|nr:DUF1080 domain-containing protein [Mucilaginibacter pedocola]OOQ58803.1 hypothetical protein BC343_09145 [Mucilaginibacter pedocola]
MKNNLKIWMLAGVTALGVQTASAQLQPGYTKLFDGKTLKGWKKLAGNADYTVADGVITGTAVLNSGNTFLVTEKEYGDFILELDVMTESNLTNSGVQVRSHYDPAGHEGKGKVYGKQCEVDPSDRAWTGGIYDEGRRDWLYPMELNAKGKTEWKPGVYNHIKIECIGNSTKTWINGTPAAYVVDTLDKKGFIGLQVHAISEAGQAGKKIFFKNIQIKTDKLKPQAFAKDAYVVNLTPNSLTDFETQGGWKLLFDGNSSKGWRSANAMTFPEKGWKVKDGMLSVIGANGGESTNGGDIISDGQYTAFDMSFEFRMSKGANSGVKYFVTLSEKTVGSAIGLEYQVLDDVVHPDAKLGRDGNRTLASLYDLITAKKQPRFTHPIGAWNIGRIIVYPNNHVEHYLNGVKVLEYDRGSQAFRDLVAISKYKVWKDFGEAKEGHILLQDHGFDVNFRSIKIKTLQ